MSGKPNEFMDAGSSESDHELGYESEDAEYSRTSRTKRRKIVSLPDDSIPTATLENEKPKKIPTESPAAENVGSEASPEKSSKLSTSPTKKSTRKPSTPGIIYLSSLPPYLKPSALRNLLTQRGFGPITRLFLSPTNPSKSKIKSPNSRQLYSEGWLEFPSRRTARLCAESLNANPVGGRKGGFYRDDVWNMRYLRGVGWADLMGQVREERREEEVRGEEERRQINWETRGFVEAVERGKREKGVREGRKKRGREEDEVVEGNGEGDERGWTQYQPKIPAQKGGEKGEVSEEVEKVLSKIF